LGWRLGFPRSCDVTNRARVGFGEGRAWAKPSQGFSPTPPLPTVTRTTSRKRPPTPGAAPTPRPSGYGVSPRDRTVLVGIGIIRAQANGLGEFHDGVAVTLRPQVGCCPQPSLGDGHECGSYRRMAYGENGNVRAPLSTRFQLFQDRTGRRGHFFGALHRRA
jgi:hypothetical protein